MISPHLAVLANDGIVLEQHYRSETVYHIFCFFNSILKNEHCYILTENNVVFENYHYRA